MTVIGILGGTCRAEVDGCGNVQRADRSRLGWYVAAEDRWHRPADEPTVRQRRVQGTPVVETKLRIPGGDAVQRVWCTADGGGLVMVDVHNGSPVAMAVAFDRGDIWLPRGGGAPVAGIALPADAVAVPVGHAASGRIAWPLDPRRRGSGSVPADATADAAVRGWLRFAERGSRLELADPALVDAVVAARCDLALADDPGSADDGEALVAAGQLAALGLVDRLDVADIAGRVERVLRAGAPTWLGRTGLDGAAVALAALGERRALADLAAAVGHLGRPPSAPERAPTGIAVVPWAERRLVGTDGSLLPGGFDPAWLGAPIEAHGVPVGASRVSVAVRWHGARPAVLWEVDGPPVRLSSPVVAPGWSTTEARGETLWPAPPAGV